MTNTGMRRSIWPIVVPRCKKIDKVRIAGLTFADWGIIFH